MLSGGRDLVFTLGRARRTSAAARTARRLVLGFGGFRFVTADSRWKHIERDRLAAARPSAVTFGILARLTIVTLLAPRTPLAIEALTAIGALRALVGSGFFARLDELLVTFVLVDLVLTPGTLFIEARAILAEHAEIMVRILKKIFGLDAVARKLRVARHALVFFEQLGGVAALAIVLTVPRLSAEVRAPLSTAAAPATALSIVDQMLRPYAVVL